MKNVLQKKYSINDVKKVVYDPSYDALFNEETKKSLEGYEIGQLTKLGDIL